MLLDVRSIAPVPDHLLGLAEPRRELEEARDLRRIVPESGPSSIQPDPVEARRPSGERVGEPQIAHVGSALGRDIQAT